MTETLSRPRLSFASANSPEKTDRIAQLEAEIDRMIADRRLLVAQIQAMALALLREERTNQDDWMEGDNPVPFWPSGV